MAESVCDGLLDVFRMVEVSWRWRVVMSVVREIMRDCESSLALHERRVVLCESLRAFTSVLREAMGVDGFGRVMSTNVAFCMQMSRQVYICRAFLAFLAAVVGVFLHLLARFGGQFTVAAESLRT